jgi:hypothetical protein
VGRSKSRHGSRGGLAEFFAERAPRTSLNRPIGADPSVRRSQAHPSPGAARRGRARPPRHDQRRGARRLPRHLLVFVLVTAFLVVAWVVIDVHGFF